MSSNIIQLNEAAIKGELKDFVRNSVEETLNELLDHEADELVNAERYERSSNRKGLRSGHYSRNFTTTSGDVTLHVPKLKGVQFETAIIERYRRRECSIEEALVEMYLAGVSVRRVEDITEALWGTKVSSGTISNLNKKAYEHIEEWRTRPLTGEYRNVFSVVSQGKMQEVAMMLKAIHAQENKAAARMKAVQVVKRLREMKLTAAAKKVEDGIEETLTYMDFPSQHWTRIRTHNTLERLNREIKRRTKAIGAFPDGQSALMLVCARLRHVAGTDWGVKRYMNMDHLREMVAFNQQAI